MSKTDDPAGSIRGEELSALVDGELAHAEVGRACDQWRADPDARAAWHSYHLIGDVLRSGDLSSTPEHDRDFLASLRQRLAQEPVVLAPARLPLVGGSAVGRVLQGVGDRFGRPLRTSAAVAAGFVLVAGVLLATQLSPMSETPVAPVVAMVANPKSPTTPPSMAAPVVALYGVPAAGALAAVDRQVVEDAPTLELDGQLIRDARLDEYLAAHKKFGGSSAPGGPSGFLRNAAVESR